jgi:hypothetical protein
MGRDIFSMVPSEYLFKEVYETEQIITTKPKEQTFIKYKLVCILKTIVNTVYGHAK